MYLFDYRELIKNLVISDLKTKYANSVLGFAWSLLNPLAMFIVYFLVFSNMFGGNGGFSDYLGGFVGYLLVGLVTWRLFQNGTSYAMGSIVTKSSLVSKIAIPRNLLTLSLVLSNMISSILEFSVLVLILLLLEKGLPVTILLFPVLHAISFMIIYGFGLILSSLFVYYRDMSQIWEVVVQAGFFLSPIVYSISIIPERFLFVYSLNPLTVLIGMYRDIFLKGVVPSIQEFAIVIVFGIILVAIGSCIFNHLSRRFAEVV